MRRRCAICKTDHPGVTLCPENTQARQDGVDDHHFGRRRNADRWPPGTYGHADYELGWVIGHTTERAPVE